MVMNNRLLRPKTEQADPPVQLKAEDNYLLVAEDGHQLTTG